MKKNLFINLLLALFISSQVYGASYYVSSSAGNDSNSGSQSQPYKTLAKISATSLSPGDKVFFKRGDRFNGHFVVNGSGTASNPIKITAYGSGAKPIITGQVGSANGGDYQEAILVQNNDNIIFQAIEVQNERKISRSGVNDYDAYGVLISNTGTVVMKNIVFRNVTFKNVFAPKAMLDPSDFDKISVTALKFNASKVPTGSDNKYISDVLVENCYFANNQRFGIVLMKVMNAHVQNNTFYYNGGSGVLVNSGYNTLIEKNKFDHPGASTDARMPGRGSSVWNIKCKNTVMQYNTCLSTRGYLDSHGLHIDNENENTFIQYNYMEDCEGGFVEILRGNKNAVYRFNVSVNDGFRYSDTWSTSNHTIWVNAVRHDPATFNLGDGIYIYNNTVVINKPYTSGVTQTSVTIDATNVNVFNNIFTSTNGGVKVGGHVSILKDEVGNVFSMKNNLFYGNIGTDFIAEDSNPFSGNPKFTGTGTYQDAYVIKDGSPALNKGITKQGPKIPDAFTNVFSHVPSFPNVDIYGNPVDLSSGKPNVGACNLKFTASLVSFKNVGSNNYMSSADANKLQCNTTTVGATEKFEIIDNTDGTVSLKGSNDKYVSSENGTKEMTCTRSAISAWEKFTMVDLGSNVYALKGNNGLYVRNNMLCTATTTGDWQKFVMTTGLKSASINIPSSNVEFKVFPNPATSHVIISGISGEEINAILYDVQGTMIRNTIIDVTNQEAQYNVSNLPQGVYLLKILNKEMNKTVRFVKE